VVSKHGDKRRINLGLILYRSGVCDSKEVFAGFLNDGGLDG
jgi:hypothetical protein